MTGAPAGASREASAASYKPAKNPQTCIAQPRLRTLRQMSAHASDPHSAAPLDLDREEDIAALPLRAQELLAAENLEAYSALLTQVQGIEVPTAAIGQASGSSSALWRQSRPIRAATCRRSTPTACRGRAGRARARAARAGAAQLRRRRAVRAVEPRRRAARCSRRPSAWTRSCRRSQRNLAAARPRAASARGAPRARSADGPAARQRSPTGERRAHELAARAQPAEGLRAEPLHDRARRAGDAAALPRGGRRRRRRDRRRRHRLDRPHDRDRALLRRARDRARVDRLLRRRAQRRPSTRRAATGCM